MNYLFQISDSKLSVDADICVLFEFANLEYEIENLKLYSKSGI